MHPRRNGYFQRRYALPPSLPRTKQGENHLASKTVQATEDDSKVTAMVKDKQIIVVDVVVYVVVVHVVGVQEEVVVVDSSTL